MTVLQVLYWLAVGIGLFAVAMVGAVVFYGLITWIALSLVDYHVPERPEGRPVPK